MLSFIFKVIVLLFIVHKLYSWGQMWFGNKEGCKGIFFPFANSEKNEHSSPPEKSRNNNIYCSAPPWMNRIKRMLPSVLRKSNPKDTKEAMNKLISTTFPEDVKIRPGYIFLPKSKIHTINYDHKWTIYCFSLNGDQAIDANSRLYIWESRDILTQEPDEVRKMSRVDLHCLQNMAYVSSNIDLLLLYVPPRDTFNLNTWLNMANQFL